MTEQQRGSGSGCLKGCAIGCGISILLGLVLAIGCPYLVMRPFRQAVETRETLEERYGDQSAYTPAADGSIPAERIEAFLSIRASLTEMCDDFTAACEQMKSMEQFDDQEDVSERHVLMEGLKAVRSAMGLAPLMGEHFTRRNRALLEAEMGLGEYTYLYVMAYHRHLQAENEFSEFLGEDPINGRVSANLVEMLGRQLESLQQAAADPQEIAAVENEIAALQGDSDRLPWQEGLPPAISSSLAPFTERIDQTFCPAITGLDLAINEQHGISIHTR